MQTAKVVKTAAAATLVTIAVKQHLAKRRQKKQIKRIFGRKRNK